jgi:hypothetical protein
MTRVMVAATTLDQEAASLVRRSYAGDQNAMATIYRIGEVARKGGGRARQAYASIEAYIRSNPPSDAVMGLDTPSYKRIPIKSGTYSIADVLAQPDPEMNKKQLPRGSLDGIHSADSMASTIVKACQHRHGLGACAVVLAGGPVITADRVAQIAASNFGSDLATQTFIYGVKNPDDKTVAPHLDEVGQRCLAVGQCVGRAMRLQALRGLDCPISVHSPVAGWELGE